jgi:hypothetical protein
MSKRWALGLILSLCVVVLTSASSEAGVLDATWTAPTTNTDGSPLTDLASFRVYYGTSTSPCGGSSFLEVPAASSSPSPNQEVNARLRGLVTGTRYYVTVIAVDQGGNPSSCPPVANAIAQISFGVSPATTVNFGTVNRGSVVDQTLTVSNLRAGTVSGTVATSPPFSIVSGGSFTLNGAGSTHSVTVRFSPSKSGSASSNVNVNADGDNVSLLVTGTALAAPVRRRGGP